MALVIVGTGFLIALAMTACVAVDAARRQRNWLAWATLVSVTSVVGLIVWLIVRRRTPVVVQLGSRRAILLSLMAVLVLALNFVITDYIHAFVVQVARVEG